MATDYLLIDFENIVPNMITELQDNQIVLIFTGARQNKIGRDLVISTQPFGKQIQWIAIDGNGKNAADFHIAYYLGLYSEQEHDASFTIISKDTGFDPLIKHLVSKGRKCARITDISKFTKPKPAAPKSISKHKKGTEDIVTELKNYFLKCNEKLRPKKTSKFIAFVKSRGNLEESVVKAVVDKMVADKLVEIQGEKITYLFGNLV